MFFHWLRKIVDNDGRLRAVVESNFHGAQDRQKAVSGQSEGANMYHPVCIFYVGNPTAASQMGEVVRKVGLRNCARWRRGVDGLIM